MQGKRSSAVLRKFLLQACKEVETKGLSLAERVFVPENFSQDRAAEIARRRGEALSIVLFPRSRTVLQEADRQTGGCGIRRRRCLYVVTQI